MRKIRVLSIITMLLLVMTLLSACESKFRRTLPVTKDSAQTTTKGADTTTKAPVATTTKGADSTTQPVVTTTKGGQSTTAPVVTTTKAPIITTPVVTTTAAPASDMTLAQDPTGNGYYPSKSQVKTGTEFTNVDKKTIAEYLASPTKYAKVLVEMEGYAVSIDTTNPLGLFYLMDAEGNSVYVYGCSKFSTEFGYTQVETGGYTAALTHKTGTLFDYGAKNFITNNKTLIEEGQYVRLIGLYSIYNGTIEYNTELVGTSTKNISDLGAIYAPTASGDNVTVSFNKSSYNINENCTATLTPQSGYAITNVTLMRINGENETLTVTDNKVTFKVGYADKLIITAEDSSISTGTKKATFNFGTDDTSKTHTDGSAKDAYEEKSGSYTLTLKDLVKVYTNAYDQTGKACIKLGTGSATPSFSFTVGSDIDYVIIYISGYKGSNVTVTINGQEYSVTTHSNDGEYTELKIDTRTNKTIAFSANARAMLNTIEFYSAS